MSRLKNITAIVLRKRPFTERDLIISLLTEEGEKLEVVAKGAANTSSKRKSHLDNLNLIKGTLYEGKSHPYLQSVHCEESFHLLKNNLDAILRTQILIETIDQMLLPDDPHPKIYELTLANLHELNKKDAQIHLAEASLTKLAHALGFLTSFKHCAECHSELKEDDARWDSKAGTLHCQSCAKGHEEAMDLNTRKALEFFKRASLRDIAKLRLKATEHSQITQTLHHSLLAHCHKPLKSLQLAQ